MFVSEHRYAPGTSQPRHAHAVTTVSILLAGSLRERVGQSEQYARPLSVVVKPLDTEHADDFGPDGARLLRITLSQDAARAALPRAHGLARWRWMDAGPACRPFLRLARALRDPQVTDDAIERLAWDVLALLEGTRADRVGRDPPGWLANARAALDDDPAPPRLSQLAAHAGVHPIYLARQFRRFYGCSTTDHLQRRRVQRAAALIAAGRLPLARVALAAGYSDQPHMGRVFRRETGLAPGAFRDLTTQVPIVQDTR